MFACLQARRCPWDSRGVWELQHSAERQQLLLHSPLTVTQLLSALRYTFHSPLEKGVKEIALHLYFVFYRKKIMIPQPQHIKCMKEKSFTSLCGFFFFSLLRALLLLIWFGFCFLEKNCIMFHNICIVAASLDRISSLPGTQLSCWITVTAKDILNTKDLNLWLVRVWVWVPVPPQQFETKSMT